MSFIDSVQILILLLLILLILKPFYSRWLPAAWHGMIHRLMPPRALKYEGTWRRKPADRDKDKS
ncbi:cellulose biosynthesis protein BcsF [Erwiniaceae bacterium BAC15a-03b]|uniref:Cellulose biosynthesis protein BcsF n=1 Tax=Winslowiella arboricola TaxID=2978220 RepID=A0A9J6PQ49_9GAMM|nr:cellulose biosynthesis protein BcsF [Winslowiella arboricola]MCU5773834.1 cellulose biosynthesis protein BcsF [Winslowiella arboricola]MCU5777744.1 cellulose biosynthesis protein BcsF [Winslowiella arboricola]